MENLLLVTIWDEVYTQHLIHSTLYGAIYWNQLERLIVIVILTSCEDCKFMSYTGVRNVFFRIYNVNQMMRWRIKISFTLFRILVLTLHIQVIFRVGQEFSGQKLNRKLLRHILIGNCQYYLPTISKVPLLSRLDYSAVLCALERRWLNENVTISSEYNVELQRNKTT